MADFLTRLIDRGAAGAPIVRPVIPAAFAVAHPGADPVEEIVTSDAVTARTPPATVPSRTTGADVAHRGIATESERSVARATMRPAPRATERIAGRDDRPEATPADVIAVQPALRVEHEYRTESIAIEPRASSPSPSLEAPPAREPARTIEERVRIDDEATQVSTIVRTTTVRRAERSALALEESRVVDETAPGGDVRRPASVAMTAAPAVAVVRPTPEPATTGAKEPSVRIAIGRVEVRIAQQPRPEQSRPEQPLVSLDDYLRRQGRSAR